MDLSLRFLRACEVAPIKHRVIFCHVVTHYFQNHVEFADHDFIHSFVASEKRKRLSNSDSKHISQLPNESAQFKYTFSKQLCLSSLLLWSICDYKWSKLESWIFFDLILVNWEVKSVGRKNRVWNCSADISPTFFTFAVKLQSYKVVEFFREGHIFYCDLQATFTTRIHFKKYIL